MTGHKIKVLNLFKNILRAGYGFKDYNFRSYVLRRAVEDFREFSTLTDKQQIADKIHFAEEQLALIRRQQIIQNMYFTTKSVVEA